ncbi:MAG: hypothetical protein WBN75_15645 [Verrucomicrobiia bacterium]|jgi:hypothetical protein
MLLLINCYIRHLPDLTRHPPADCPVIEEIVEGFVEGFIERVGTIRRRIIGLFSEPIKSDNL